MPEDWAHIVFDARLSSGERAKVNSTLRESLQHTMNCHDLVYGPIRCTTDFLTFAHMSNLPLAIHGEVDRFFAQAINTAKATGGKLLVVMNGWDGLTTDPGSFMGMFRASASSIKIRVFAEVPRSFWQVDVEQAIKVFNGTIRINPYLEELMPHDPFDAETQEQFRLAEAQLEHSTAWFCRELLLQAIKMDYASVKQALQKKHSKQQNTDPDMTTVDYRGEKAITLNFLKTIHRCSYPLFMLTISRDNRRG